MYIKIQHLCCIPSTLFHRQILIMNPDLAFWIVFAILAGLIIICDLKYHMLRDISKAAPQPYSWSRVQLAWWTVIVLSSFITIFLTQGAAPTFHESTLILLGISGATTATARVIDIADEANPKIQRHQDTGRYH